MQKVVTSAAINFVVAVPCVDAVVAAVAVDQIVVASVAREDRVITVDAVAVWVACVRPVDEVVASGTLDGAVWHRDADCLQVEWVRGICWRNADQCDAFTIREGQNRVARPVVCDNNIVGAHGCAGRVACWQVVKVGDVEFINACEGRAAACWCVKAANDVVARAVLQHNHVGRAVCRSARAKVDRVVACARVDAVSACASCDRIVACGACDAIGARACDDLFDVREGRSVCARCERASLRARHVHGCGRGHGRGVKDVYVGVAYILGAVDRINAKPVAKDDLIRASAADDAVVARAAYERIIAVAAFKAVIARVAKQNIIANTTVDAVIVVAAVDGVVASSHVDGIVAVSAFGIVVARRCVDAIVASAAIHAVVAIVADDHVIARVAIKAVIASVAVDGVVAFAAVHQVIAVVAEEGIVAEATVDRIVAATCGDVIVACAAVDIIGGCT